MTEETSKAKNRDLKAFIKDGRELVVTVPLLDEPVRSQSGKTRLVVNTGGSVVTDANVAGMPVIVNLNAYIRG
jgi:hypothetical protein